MAGVTFDEDDPPLISCILPTYNRRRFLPHAIRYFLRQDYPNRELLVVDDGPDAVGDLVPADPRIRYVRLPQKITLGAKLNLCCAQTSGPIIAQWDDDDWYGHDRLTRQLHALSRTNADVCGISDLLYYDLKRGTGHRYIYPRRERPWLSGASLFFRRELWERLRFVEVDVGSDGLFVWATPPEKVCSLPPPRFAVHFIHGDNVSPKATQANWWSDHPVAGIAAVMGDDWQYYSPAGEALPAPRPCSPATEAGTPTPEARPDHAPTPPVLDEIRQPIMTAMRQVPGWLYDEEADLLITVTERALAACPDVRALVEIGSFRGKGTTVIASVVRAIRPSARVWAVDPHDGVVGDRERGVSHEGPTLESFRQNIAQAGVEAVVVAVEASAPDVAWSEPICFLLVDGLHDHASVARDFNHFEAFLADSALIAFHDYADYFPGVKTFVDDLLRSERYLFVERAASLIVLRKRMEPEQLARAQQIVPGIEVTASTAMSGRSEESNVHA
jgi:hypothetical protein